MKLFPISNHYSRSTQNLISIENKKLNSFQDYLLNFTPNYKILNGTPCFWTTQELLDRGYIALAYVGGDDDKLSLIIFASKLNYNEGLVQNFYNYDAAYVFMGDPSEIESWKRSDGIYTIPRHLVTDEEQLSYTGDLLLQKNDETPEWVFSNTEQNIGELNYKKGSEIATINYDELTLESYYPVNIKLSFSSQTTVAEKSQVRELEFSNHFISKTRTEGAYNLQHNNWKDFANYQLIRLAQGGGYYTWSVGGSQSGMESILTFQSRATDSMGIKYLLSGNLYQKRFTFQYNWLPADFKSFPAFRTDDDGKMEFLIKTTQGSPWIGTEILSHEFLLNSIDNTTMEVMFLDDKRVLDTKKSNKMAMPVNDISIEQGLDLQLEPLTVLW